MQAEARNLRLCHDAGVGRELGMEMGSSSGTQMFGSGFERFQSGVDYSQTL